MKEVGGMVFASSSGVLGALGFVVLVQLLTYRVRMEEIAIILPLRWFAFAVMLVLFDTGCLW